MSRDPLIIIAHRANLYGSHPALENSPLAIDRALQAGFHVLIDVRWDAQLNEWYLGCDEPQYPVDETILLDRRVWCQARDTLALVNLLEVGAHCFWHETDQCALTSLGFVWACTNIVQFPPSRGILLLPEQDLLGVAAAQHLDAASGVCTNYPHQFAEGSNVYRFDHAVQRA